MTFLMANLVTDAKQWRVWPALVLTSIEVIAGLIVWPMQGLFPVGLFPVILTVVFCSDMFEKPERRTLRVYAEATYLAWLAIAGILLTVWVFSGGGPHGYGSVGAF